MLGPQRVAAISSSQARTTSTTSSLSVIVSLRSPPRETSAVRRIWTGSGDDDPGFDGVTVQWFESMDDYRAHMGEPDFSVMWEDIESFLDTDRLHFIVTEHPHLVMGDEEPFPLA